MRRPAESVMRRPLLLGSKCGKRRLSDLQSLRQRVEPRAQCGYLLLLPVHYIAELDIGALQERNFCFDPLDFIAGHTASVTNLQRNARPRTAQQLKPNWWFPCIPVQPGERRKARPLP